MKRLGIVAATLIAAGFIAVLVAFVVPRVINTGTGSGAPSASEPVAVETPTHPRIADDNSSISVPPLSTVCLHEITDQELNGIIHKEMSRFQHTIGQIACQDRWVYSGVSGPDIGGGKTGDPTHILLFYLEPQPGNSGGWFVKDKDGTGKEPADSPLCMQRIPNTIKPLVCAD